MLKEFEGYIGNDPIKEQLTISILAAKKMNAAPPHMLFVGHPGTGKTTLANIIANIQGIKPIESAPESLKSTQDVRDILAILPQDGYNNKGEVEGQTKPGIIFLDEIHNLPLKGQEAFGIAMEYFKISTEMVRFKRKKRITEWVPKFTLIGATTETGKLSKPFFDKFKLIFQFELYSIEQIKTIIKNFLEKNGLGIDEEAATEIAIRSRGTPRIAKRYCDRVVEIMSIIGEKNINRLVTDKVFSLLGIDEEGLTPLDRKILIHLFESGRPTGVDNLAVVTGEARKTLESTVEPFLMRKGLIIRASGGRSITERGEQYLFERKLVGTKKNDRVISEE